MADEATATTKQAIIRLKDGELELLIRLRQLRNSAGGNRIRLELELTKDALAIVNQQVIKPELFTLQA